MATAKEIDAAAKKVQTSMDNYYKAQAELEKANRNMSKYDSIMKSGDVTRMGTAAVELSKITTKLGTLHKKVVDTKKKMDEALKALSKVTPKK